MPSRIATIHVLSTTSNCHYHHVCLNVSHRIKNAQVFASTPEGLDSPPYTVLRVSATTPSGGGAKYELREYPPFTECVVSLATNANTFDSFSGDEADDATTESLADEVVRSARGFNALARYIFGANSAKQTISMTTPVMTNYDSAAAEQNEYATTMATTMTTMAFPLLSISGGATSAPLADDPCVSVSDREGETVAIVEVRCSDGGPFSQPQLLASALPNPLLMSDRRPCRFTAHPAPPRCARAFALPCQPMALAVRWLRHRRRGPTPANDPARCACGRWH